MIPQRQCRPAHWPCQAHKLEALRQLFPEAVRVEEDGYELRWVGKREAYHQAFVPAAKILSAVHC